MSTHVYHLAWLSVTIWRCDGGKYGDEFSSLSKFLAYKCDVPEAARHLRNAERAFISAGAHAKKHDTPQAVIDDFFKMSIHYASAVLKN